MMSNAKAITLLVVVAVTLTGALPVSPALEVDTEVALGLDELCGNGEHEDCTLSALQMRSEKVLATISGCQDGMVGMIREMAPDCIDSCQGSCGALNNAIQAYLTEGGQPAAQEAVCAASGDFSCFLKPGVIGECKSLIAKAAGFGIELPRSQEQLTAQCGSLLEQSADVNGAEASESPASVDMEEADDSATAGCQDGMVGMIRGMAPDCIDACQGSCGALNNAIQAYLTEGGQPAAKEAVCAASGDFSCFLKPGVIGECRSLIAKAAGFGIELPSSQEQLTAQCGSLLEQSVDVEETEASESQASVATEEADDSVTAGCQDGLVGMIRGMAPDCIDACQGSCGALDSAIQAYLTEGGQPAAKEAVCAASGDFSCFLKPGVIGECRSLIAKAAGFGIELPSSQEQLTAQCGSLLEQSADVEETEASESQAFVDTEEADDSVTAGCQDGMVGMIRGMAPDCIDACQGSCGALNNAIQAYLTEGGQPAAKEAVCAASGDFSCFLKPGVIGECRSLIAKAAGFGIELPSSQEQLTAQCGSLLEQSADVEGAEASESQASIDTEEADDSATAGCQDGMVGMIRGMAPDCIDACQGSCGALNNAIQAYLTEGGQPAAKEAVCAASGDFSCFLKPGVIGECRSLIAKAAGFGIELPSSQEQLTAQCGS